MDVTEGLKHQQPAIFHEILVATSEKKVVRNDLWEKDIQPIAAIADKELQWEQRRPTHSLADFQLLLGAVKIELDVETRQELSYRILITVRFLLNQMNYFTQLILFSLVIAHNHTDGQIAKEVWCQRLNSIQMTVRKVNYAKA